MTIKNRNEKPARIEIDLQGPDGNAFVLLGLASSMCKKLGYDKEQSDSVIKEMKSSDYNHLIKVFDREFGDFVTLWR